MSKATGARTRAVSAYNKTRGRSRGMSATIRAVPQGECYWCGIQTEKFDGHEQACPEKPGPKTGERA
jgi:hypothetical protein